MYLPKRYMPKNVKPNAANQRPFIHARNRNHTSTDNPFRYDLSAGKIDAHSEQRSLSSIWLERNPIQITEQTSAANANRRIFILARPLARSYARFGGAVFVSVSGRAVDRRGHRDCK